MLSLLEQAVAGEKYGEIFAATAQLAKQENESFENILALFYSLLTDLLESSRAPESSLPRNPDLRREIGGPRQEDRLGLGSAAPRVAWTRSKAACAAISAASWVWTLSSLLSVFAEGPGPT